MGDNDPQDRSPDFRIVLRPLPGGSPVDVRLKRALKCLLRAFGFRALQVVEVKPSDRPGRDIEGRRT
jgi:hypothetical protein